jgi:hypothetical protein
MRWPSVWRGTTVALIVAVVGLVLFAFYLEGQKNLEEDKRLGTSITVCEGGTVHSDEGTECAGDSYTIRCNQYRYTAEGLVCDGRVIRGFPG